MGRGELAAPNGASKTDCGWECGIVIFKALASSSVAGLSQYDLKPGCIASNVANVSSANLATDSALSSGLKSGSWVSASGASRGAVRQIVILKSAVFEFLSDVAG